MKYGKKKRMASLATSTAYERLVSERQYGFRPRLRSLRCSFSEALQVYRCFVRDMPDGVTWRLYTSWEFGPTGFVATTADAGALGT